MRGGRRVGKGPERRVQNLKAETVTQSREDAPVIVR